MTKYYTPGQPSLSRMTREQCEASIATQLAMQIGKRLGCEMSIEKRCWYNMPDNSVNESMDDEPTRSVAGYVLHADPIERFRDSGASIVLGQLLGRCVPALDAVTTPETIAATADEIVAGRGERAACVALGLWVATITTAEWRS